MKKAPVILACGVLATAGVLIQVRSGDRARSKAASSPRVDTIPATPAAVPPPAAALRLTAEMRETLTGLDSLFSENELAFRHAGPAERVAEALESYQSHPLLALAQLQRALAGLDPAMFGSVYTLFLEKLPPEQVTAVDAYRILFRTWGAVDGSTALTTAATRLPKNLVRLEAGREAMQSWARLAPAATAQAVAALPDIYGKDYLVYALPHTYILADPAAAMAWAGSLPPALRANTLLHCMITWLDTDPRAARAYATELAGRPDAVDDGNGVIFSRTAGALARKEVAEAVRWVEQLPPESKARQQATLGLMDWWAMTAPDKAGAWLGRFPPSANLDPVVDRFARDLARQDPAAASDWAATITDPALRTKCLGAVQPLVTRSFSPRP